MRNQEQLQQRILAEIPLLRWRDNLPRFQEDPGELTVDHPDVDAFRSYTLREHGTDPIYCGILLSLELCLSEKHSEIVSSVSELDLEGSDPFSYCSESIRDRAYDILISKRVTNPIRRDDWESFVRRLTRQVVYLSCEHPYIPYANRIVPTMSKVELQTLSKTFSIANEGSFASVLEIQKHLVDLASMETNYYAVILSDMSTVPRSFSCFPNAQLEWPDAELVKIYDDDNTCCTIMPVLESEDRDKAYQQRTGASCRCTRCQYEVMGVRDIVSQPLARFYMAKGDLKAAKDLYEAALPHATETSKLDILHALGAIELGNGNFIGAQRIWQEAIVAGGEPALAHKGLQLQREKMLAYSYLETLPSKAIGEFPVDSPLPGAFVAHVMDSARCQKVIEWTESHSTWTAGRHHAVPTRDIPVHTIPDLLQWFRTELMDRIALPLLIKCFGGEQFYVHDAFVVKYEASTISNYLSLRGGTYFHRDQKVVRLPVGSILIFRGDQLFHGGQPVTSGTRYILAAFLYQQLQQSKGSQSLVAEALRDAKKQKTEFSFSFLTDKGE